MSSNLLELIKVDLRATLDKRKFKENKAQSASFITFIVLFGILFLFISILYNFMFTLLFKEGGLSLSYSVAMFSGLAAVLTFSTSVFKAKSIFIGKDYEMLSAMPIRKFDIIASKIINLYILELLYSAIVLIPNGVICSIFSGNFIYILTGILGSIFVPAVPMLLACLFALFVTLVADRFRFGNVINIILYMIMFACIFAFSFAMNMSNSVDENEMLDMSGYINITNIVSYINPTVWFLRWGIDKNFLFLLAFVGINIVVFVIATLFISLLFNTVYTAINSYKSNIKYERKTLKIDGQFGALRKRDYKSFLRSKFYFINCFSSGICAIVMAAMIAFVFSKWSPMLQAEEEEAKLAMLTIFKGYSLVGIFAITFGIGIATPASCAISMEGQNFWMIKSMPIDYKQYLKSKLFLSFEVLGVCSIVSSVIIIAMIQPDVVSSIMIILIPLVFVFLTSCIGLLINTKRYKLKWKNEQEAVKNSSAVVISMLVDWLIMIIMAVLICVPLFTLGFAPWLNALITGSITLVVLLIASICFYKYLMSVGPKRIEEIEEF